MDFTGKQPPLLNDASADEPIAPSWAIQRDPHWGPFRRSREAHAGSRRAIAPDARADAIKRRRQALVKSFKETCFAPLLESSSTDIQLRALCPLGIGDYEMPTFPTKLELVAMKHACDEFGQLNDTAAGHKSRDGRIGGTSVNCSNVANLFAWHSMDFVINPN